MANISLSPAVPMNDHAALVEALEFPWRLKGFIMPPLSNEQTAREYFYEVSLKIQELMMAVSAQASKNLPLLQRLETAECNRSADTAHPFPAE